MSVQKTSHDKALNEHLLLQELEAEVRKHFVASPTPITLSHGNGGDKSRVNVTRFLASRPLTGKLSKGLSGIRDPASSGGGTVVPGQQILLAKRPETGVPLARNKIRRIQGGSTHCLLTSQGKDFKTHPDIKSQCYLEFDKAQAPTSAATHGPCDKRVKMVAVTTLQPSAAELQAPHCENKARRAMNAAHAASSSQSHIMSGLLRSDRPMSAPERDWQNHSRTPRATSWARGLSAKTSGGLAQGLDQVKASVRIQLYTTKANAISHVRFNGIPAPHEPVLVDQAPVPYRAQSPRGPAAVVAEMRHGETLDTIDFTEPPAPANDGERDSVGPADTLLSINSTLMILSSPGPSSDLTPPPKVYWPGNVSEAAWNARMMRTVSARTRATSSSTQAAKHQLPGEMPSLYAQTFKRSVSAASQDAAKGAHKLKVRPVSAGLLRILSPTHAQCGARLSSETLKVPARGFLLSISGESVHYAPRHRQTDGQREAHNLAEQIGGTSFCVQQSGDEEHGTERVGEDAGPKNNVSELTIDPVLSQERVEYSPEKQRSLAATASHFTQGGGAPGQKWSAIKVQQHFSPWPCDEERDMYQEPDLGFGTHELEDAIETKDSNPTPTSTYAASTAAAGLIGTGLISHRDAFAAIAAGGEGGGGGGGGGRGEEDGGGGGGGRGGGGGETNPRACPATAPAPRIINMITSHWVEDKAGVSPRARLLSQRPKWVRPSHALAGSDARAADGNRNGRDLMKSGGNNGLGLQLQVANTSAHALSSLSLSDWPVILNQKLAPILSMSEAESEDVPEGFNSTGGKDVPVREDVTGEHSDAPQHLIIQEITQPPPPRYASNLKSLLPTYEVPYDTVVEQRRDEGRDQGAGPSAPAARHSPPSTRQSPPSANAAAIARESERARESLSGTILHRCSTRWASVYVSSPRGTPRSGPHFGAEHAKANAEQRFGHGKAVLGCAVQVNRANVQAHSQEASIPSLTLTITSPDTRIMSVRSPEVEQKQRLGGLASAARGRGHAAGSDGALLISSKIRSELMQFQAVTVIQRDIPVRSLTVNPQRVGAFATPKSKERQERLRSFISHAKLHISKGCSPREWGVRSEDRAALERGAEKEEEGKGNARDLGREAAEHTRTAEGKEEQVDAPGFAIHPTPYTYRVATPLEEVQGHIKPLADRSKTVPPFSRDAQDIIGNACTRASVQREEGGQDVGDVGLMSAERERYISSNPRERERGREGERVDTFSGGLKLERSAEPLQHLPRSPMSPKGKRDSFLRFLFFNL